MSADVLELQPPQTPNVPIWEHGTMVVQKWFSCNENQLYGYVGEKKWFKFKQQVLGRYYVKLPFCFTSKTLAQEVSDCGVDSPLIYRIISI